MQKDPIACRYPLLGLGMLAGLCGGLLRIGWGEAHVLVSLALAHGSDGVRLPRAHHRGRADGAEPIRPPFVLEAKR